MKKKLLPALLALVMVLGLLPLAAFAAPEDTGPVVAGYGFIWDATKQDLGLVEGAETSGDWMNETMYVYFSNTGSNTTNLWFQIQVGEDTWGCAANGSKDGAANTYAFSFLNRGTQWELHPTIQNETFDYSGKSVTHAKSYMKDSNTVTLSVYTPANAITGEQNTAPTAEALGKAIFTKEFTIAKDTDINQAVENTPEEPEVIAVAKSVFIVNDETSYNKLPSSYTTEYPFETYKDSAVPTFPWLVATYSRKSASELTYEVTKDGNAVTLPEDGATTPDKANDDAYIMWRIKDADGLNQTNPYGAYVVSIKLDDQTVELGEVTFTAPVDPNPPVEDTIEGTVTGEGDEAVLKPAENDVKNKVDSELADTSKDKVEIVVVPASGEADKTEVPLNTGALGALESVTKPVVIDTPQGGVALPANTLVDKTGTDAAVTFKMDNTSTAATVETYEVGFYDDQGEEVEVKDLPASTITLTFKTSFTKDDKVVVSSGSTIVKATVGAEGVVNVTTTHLSEWTIRKEAGAVGGYVKFAADDGKQHLTPGYVYIANGKTTYGEVKQNDNYLVQVETTGGTILSLAVADAQGLKIPCNKTGKMSVWQVGSGSVDITNVTGTDIQDKQVIYQVNLATLNEVAAPGTP